MTLTPYSSTTQDIILLMQNIVKSRLPEANIEEGFPIYDLVITPFADLVYSGRETAYVLQQVNSVLLLFDDDGNLEYPAYEDTLRSRYFITQSVDKTDDSYLYLTFTQKTDFVVNRGSYARLGNGTVELFPIIGAKESPYWEVKGSLFAYKVPIKSLTGSLSVSASADWDIAGVNAVVNTGTLRSAYTTDPVTDVATPTLTQQALSDSISNRSFSNPRSLRYHFATDNAFHPESLVQYNILRANDREFVEGYKEIYKVTSSGVSVPIQVRTGGLAKVLFDYGYDVYQTKNTLEYVSPEEPCPFSASPLPNRSVYRIPIPNSDGLLSPIAIYSAIDDGKDFTTSIDTDIQNYNLNPHLFTTDQVFDGTAMRSYTMADPILKLALTPGASYTTSDIYEPGLYVAGTANFLSYIEGIELYNIANSLPVEDSAEFIVKLDFQTGNTAVVASIYRWTAGATVLTWYAEGSIASITAPGLSSKPIELKGASGSVLGEITLQAITAASPTTLEATALRGVLATQENKVIRGSSILGVANNFIYLEVVVAATSAIHLYRALHGRVAYIGHIGTDPALLESAASALANKDNREMPSTTLAGPYRPALLHLELNRDYLYPLSESPTADETSRYKILVGELAEYLSDQPGDIALFNLRDIADSFSESTGYHIKKLDVMMYSQSGLELLKGQLTTDDTASDSIDMTTMTPNLTSRGIPSTVIAEEESTTRTSMYKFILSNTYRTL